jgi:hypothetical protein
MKILEYTGLDTSRVKASYRKVADAIARHDFRAAQVKKLVNLSHGKFYRARLDDATGCCSRWFATATKSAR